MNPLLKPTRTRTQPTALDDLNPVAQSAALAVHHYAHRLGFGPDESGMDALRELVDALGLKTRVWTPGKCRCCGREMPITNASGSRDDKVRHGYCSRTCSDNAH